MPTITEELKAIFNRKLREANEKFETRIDCLIEEYNNGSINRNEIARQITQLFRAFNQLKKSYEEAAARITHDLERDIMKNEDFFEAKLKDAPHDWD